MSEELKKVKAIVEWAESISGEWNGDESGIQEDRANIANEIAETCALLSHQIIDLEEIL